jgi:hypothetical protein
MPDGNHITELDRQSSLELDGCCSYTPGSS